MPGRPAFIGRAREQGVLRSALVDATTGHGRLLLLSGEAGIGKTRITEQFGREASEWDCVVLRGVCHHSDEAPYSPFLEVLDGLRRAVAPPDLAGALAGGAAEVVRLMPEIRRWVPGLPPAAAVPPEHERRLLSSVSRIWSSSSAPSGRWSSCWKTCTGRMRPRCYW